MKQANCCADPFSVHKKKVVSMLRVVSETVRLQHPKLLLEKDDKLCSNCRKKLQQLQDSTSSSASQDEGDGSQDADDENVGDISITIQEHELGVLNESLKSLEQTPVSKRKLESEQYPRKKLRVETAVRKKLELISRHPLPDSEETQCEMITQLKDKFNKTELRSEKLTILTVLPRSWTLATIKEEFEVSDYMARQAKTLVREKGILSSANCRAGKSLSKDIVNVVQDFYKSDSVSRIMPGMKDYVSVKKDGVRVHEQKHLVLCNLKEAYHLFKEKFPEDS